MSLLTHAEFKLYSCQGTPLLVETMALAAGLLLVLRDHFSFLLQ